MLENKNAIIYGAGGSLGGAVARALAAAGARVFLTGHRLESIRRTADAITAEGRMAEVSVVDALDEKAVNQHLAEVVSRAGTVDIIYNAIDLQVVQNMPLTDLSVEDFVRPVRIAMETHFLTCVAAARVMMKQGSGVILSLTATPGGIGYPLTGGFGPACCAIEGFSRNLASEVGVYGIRVINMRSAGSPDSRLFKEAIESHPVIMKEVLGKMEADTMLKRLPEMADIASLAVFLASDHAKAITGVTIDVTAGTTAALNYRIQPNDGAKSTSAKIVL